MAQLDNTALGQYTVMYYDNLGRMVQSKAGNHLNGVEREYINYSFAGQPINRKHIHSGPTTQTELYTYKHDNFGRLESTTHQLNGGAEVVLSTNTYDKVGRLATTTKGGGLNLKQAIGYNVRSWMTSMTGSLYSQTNSYGTYSGNISAMSWTVGDASQCNYAFTYDNLSRLRSATYTGDGQFGTSYSYDKHGNITALSRSGRNTTGSTYGTVDNLSFTYDGNQVTRITDGQKISFAESGDFRDYAARAGANSYNANGALISDSHKGILGIGYNLLNLPREVAVKTSAVSGKVYYIYAADGTKLQTRHLNGSSMVPVIFGNTVSDALLPTKKTTDYVGNMVYENGSLKRILIDGGYIEEGVYNYYLKDHLGNNRVVLNGEGAVVQQTTYYPFGMAFATNTVAEQDKQPYKFGGKGLDRQNGLNLYDFSARQYEPAIGRFTTQDPLAEKYYSISPYAYCSNNPITRIDPTGCNDDWFMTPQGNVYWTNKKTKTITVGDEVHQNIGTSYSYDMANGDTKYFYQTTGNDGSLSLASHVFSRNEMSVFDMFHSDNARNAAITEHINPSTGNFLGMIGAELAAQWTDPYLLVAGATAGLSGWQRPAITNTGAHNAANAGKLAKQLASQQQMGEVGTDVYFTNGLRSASRLSTQYGGSPNSWIKKSSSSFSTRGTQFETHWYENQNTGQRVEYKTKLHKLNYK